MPGTRPHRPPATLRCTILKRSVPFRFGSVPFYHAAEPATGTRARAGIRTAASYTETSRFTGTGQRESWITTR
jgi:hypothetical protein